MRDDTGSSEVDTESAVREEGEEVALAGDQISVVGARHVLAASPDTVNGRRVAVFGNEGAGVPHELLALADERITIPHSERVESLNAGIAASIVLYEAARQRNSK